MANKNKKANDANWMAVLQAFQRTPQGNAAAVASTMMSDIKRDGADQEDIHRNAANVIFAQANDPVAFLENMLNEHPDMEKELDAYLDEKQIQLNSVEELVPIIQSYLKEKRKYGEGGQFEESNNFIDVEINGIFYHLLYLVSEEEKEIGLMNVEELDPQEGALFDYSDEPQAELSFWMKDTTIPLLICFINENGKVISVHQGQPMSEEMITESSEFIAYVIEVGINETIKPGYQTSLGKQDINEEIEDDEDEEDVHPELNVNRLYVYGSDGEVQAELQGGERIFSRKSSRVIISKAKKAYVSKEDKDYKSLGRYIFKEMDAQDNRDPEYVEN